MEVCVIGSGAAGLAAGRHCLSGGLGVTIFERGDVLGGTWVYTEETGLDKFGVPIHTSMYKSLRTNLPKEVMGFPDYPIPEQEISYLPAKDILSFLNDFADHFDVRRHIKLNHMVKLVEPQGSDWSVTVVDLQSKKEIRQTFNAVMVCNGHYHTPLVSKIEGDESFPGRKVHSHDYRDPKPFKGDKVVVIGAGPSGIDLAWEIASKAKKVVLSHHSDVEIKHVFPDNVQQKPTIMKVQGSSITFQDGTTFDADVLFYCTGYKYSFPFLSKECGITVEDNFVQPLYKHMIHIERPTMCLIGLPFYVCAFSLFDLQARVFVKALKGEMTLPSREEMKSDTDTELKIRRKMGYKKKQFHMMGPLQGEYYDQLATVGNLEPLPPVFTRLHNEASRRQLEDLVNFRNDSYRIVDENNFIKVN